jgi:hypothetical protein
VDCFHEGENVIVIDPNASTAERANPKCLANATAADHAGAGPDRTQHNTEFATKWPVIAKRKTQAPGADTLKSISDKFARFFDLGPGRSS